MFRALNKITFDQVLFLIVALIGVILFSFKISSAPIIYDEFSVLNRSSFNTLSEVYSNTQSTDVHPPLMLFFLYFWLKIAGSSVFLIKLPFLLAGIGSIFLIYNLVKNWFNSSVAILTTAFFVSIQFTILYSQLTRPYITGLFFCLLFATYWTKIIKNQGTLFNYFIYILAATLCMYNHHYSLLQAGIIGLSGLFIIKKENLKGYLIINAIACLLFLPDLYLISKQFNYDGMTYIPEANLQHITNYLFYIFQFSYVPVIVVCGISIFAVFKSKKIFINKYSYLTLCWFLLPIIIGCIVSALTKPVMPIRALIFSFPFLIIFLFSFMPKMSRTIIVTFTFLILISNVFGLVFHRNHYNIFQKDVGKSSVENIEKLIKNEQIKNPYTFFNYPESNIRFYWDKPLGNYKFESLYESREVDSYKASEFRDKIASLNNDAIVLCNISDNLVNVAKEFYPYLIYRDYGFKYDFYCFSKNNTINLEKFYFSSLLNFEDEKNNLDKGYTKVVNDSIWSNHFYQFSEGDEWGPILEIKLGELLENKYSIIETQVSVFTDDINHDGHLVFEIFDEKEKIVWYSSELTDFASRTDTWQTIYFSQQLNKLGGSDKITPASVLKIYFWNKSKRSIAIDNLSISIKKGNNEIYSLIYDFEKD